MSYQNASVRRFGHRAARGAIAQADVSVKVAGGRAHLRLVVDADESSSAELTMRAQDVDLFVRALQDAARAMIKRPPLPPLPVKHSNR